RVRVAANEQLKQAQSQFLRAQQYVIVREEIARDYCQAAGVSPNQIAPILTRDQIRELKQYAQKLPGRGAQRKEFAQAISLAEQRLEHGAGATSRIVGEFPGSTETKAVDQRSIGQSTSAENWLLKMVGINPSVQQQEGSGDSHEHRPNKGTGGSIRRAGADRTDNQANTNDYEPGRNSPTAGAYLGSAGGAVPEDRAGTGEDRSGIQSTRGSSQAERERNRRSIPPVPGPHAEGHGGGQAAGDSVRRRSSTIQRPGRESQPTAMENNVERRGLSEAHRGIIDRVDAARGARIHGDLREVE